MTAGLPTATWQDEECAVEMSNLRAHPQAERRWVEMSTAQVSREGLRCRIFPIVWEQKSDDDCEDLLSDTWRNAFSSFFFASRAELNLIQFINLAHTQHKRVNCELLMSLKELFIHERTLNPAENILLHCFDMEMCCLVGGCGKKLSHHRLAHHNRRLLVSSAALINSRRMSEPRFDSDGEKRQKARHELEKRQPKRIPNNQA